MSGTAFSGTTITRLRVKSARLDPLTTQLRAARLVQVCDLQPHALPPAAILCIRTLRDPLPGKLALHHSLSVRPAPEWQRALTESLDALARNAARPFLGSVPTTAQAVVFMDRAELLACMARDWLNGDLIHHWWWKSLLREYSMTSTDERVMSAWRDAPECIPAAFQLLAAQRLLIQFVQQASTETVRAWTMRVAHVFAAPTVIEVVAAIEHDKRETSGAARALPVMPPWSNLLAAQTEVRSLSPQRELLVGVALTIARNPIAARSNDFADQVRLWLASRQKQNATAEQHPARELETNAAFVPTQDLDQIRDARVTASQALDVNNALSPKDVPLTLRTRDEMARAAPVAADALPQIEITRHDARSSGKESKYAMEAADAIDTLLGLEIIETNFGGLFYLVNAALALGLYADFSEPQRRGLDVNFWEFLARVGYHYLGDALREDALWSLLAKLTGRAKDAAEFLEPPAIEPDWLGDVIYRLNVYVTRVLGFQDASEAEWTGLALPHHARITTSATELHLAYSLDALPIQIRLSGLDRNPGWVPAAGYVIEFHFD